MNTLLGWYRSGVDVAAKMPTLSTYLGHIDPANTYWYISDMTLKENAIAKVTPPTTTAQGRYQPTDMVLAFLAAL